MSAVARTDQSKASLAVAKKEIRKAEWPESFWLQLELAHGGLPKNQVGFSGHWIFAAMVVLGVKGEETHLVGLSNRSGLCGCFGFVQGGGNLIP